MSKQAKTLTPTELRRVLDYLATRPHALRNRTMLHVSHLAGCRVGEIAALTYADVINADGSIKSEIHLDASQTKGQHSRTVWISSKLQKELAAYIKAHPGKDPANKLFYSQQRPESGFSANSLAQHFYYMYQRAGVEGASSHSGRRNFATALSSKGVSIRVLMRAMGHRNLSSTILYVDANDDMLRKAVELAG